MQRTATPFDLTEVNEGFSSLREHSSTPWYRSAFHVFAQAADAAFSTAVPLVASKYVAELVSGAYSYHYSGYRDAVTPLFPGEAPNLQDDYLVAFGGAALCLAAMSGAAAVATQRGADFLTALGGRLQHAAGVVHTPTRHPYWRLPAEAGVSALVSTWLGDGTYYPFVAATVAGINEGAFAAAARRERDTRLQSPLRGPIGHEVDILTRPLDRFDVRAAARDIAISVAIGYEQSKSNVETPCIAAIDRPIVRGDGRPSITVHGAAGGCEVELASYGAAACAKTSFCSADEVRGKVPKSGTLTLHTCYPDSSELAQLREPNLRGTECIESAYSFHLRAKYPRGDSRTHPEFLPAESLKTAEWSGVGISEHSPPFHGPTMQVRPQPDNTLAVSGVGRQNSTMSIVWPDNQRTSFNVPSSPIGSHLQDYSVRSPGPQPAGLVRLFDPNGYGPIEIALHRPSAGAHSAADTHSRQFRRLGAVAATAPLNACSPRREPLAAAEVDSSLSAAFAEYLRKLPGESVSTTAPELEHKRLQAECLNGLTTLSKAIATHVERESTEYAGRIYGLLIRELVSSMGTHDSLGTALNKRPGHLSGVMGSHLGERTAAVAKATRDALAQGHGELLRDVFNDGRKVNAMGWLDAFAQFTGRAADSVARRAENAPRYRGSAGRQAVVR